MAEYRRVIVENVKPGMLISLVRGPPDEKWRTAHQVVLHREHVTIVWEGGEVATEFNPEHVVWRKD